MTGFVITVSKVFSNRLNASSLHCAENLQCFPLWAAQDIYFPNSENYLLTSEQAQSNLYRHPTERQSVMIFQ